MSRLDDLVTDIAAAFADVTVNFVAGGLQTNRHAQKRTIIFVRSRGELSFRSVPGARPETVPVANAGTFTTQRFQRKETIEINIRAESEIALDAMFDRLVNVIFEVAGPNAFDDVTPYAWSGDDSNNSGQHERRNPSIKLLMVFLLASRSDPLPYIKVQATTTDLGIPDETAGDAPTVVNP